MHLQPIQASTHEWRKDNFPKADATQQLLGITEEVGELAHAHLKQTQGIRGDDNLHIEEAKDAVGDLVIYLMGYCSYRGWDLETIIRDTVEHVLQRDWIENPSDGTRTDEPSLS